MASKLKTELNKLRKKLRALDQRERRSKAAEEALSEHRLCVAVACWFLDDKSPQRGLQYLAAEYASSQRRRQNDKKGAKARPSQLPRAWHEQYMSRLSALSADDIDAMKEPSPIWKQRLAVAEQFKCQAQVADFVRSCNDKGIAPSAQTIIARKRTIEQVVVSECIDSAHVSPLRRHQKKWVERLRRRHGLSKGRFRVGASLTVAEKLAKV